MKTSPEQIRYIKCEQAYVIYWEQFYMCKPRLSSIMAIKLNLELIVDENQTLLASRYDLPVDMMHMVINAGHWQIFDEENICFEVLIEVKALIVGLRCDFCMNWFSGCV